MHARRHYPSSRAAQDNQLRTAATGGAKIKLVIGYAGATQSLLAFERGEVEGHPAIFWSTLKVTKAQWLEEKKIRPMMQMALKKHPDLPDVPLIFDHITNDDHRCTAELLLAPQVGGRPFITPPEIPGDRLAALRAAFVAALGDQEFLAEAAKRKLEVQLTRGEELEAIIRKAYQSAPETVAHVRSIFEEK